MLQDLGHCKSTLWLNIKLLTHKKKGLIIDNNGSLYVPQYWVTLSDRIHAFRKSRHFPQIDFHNTNIYICRGTLGEGSDMHTETLSKT